VPYTPAQMFELVLDFESYPEFVPGVVGARLVDRSEGELKGTLELAQGPLRARLTTHNHLYPPGRMTLRQVEGPLRRMDGEWRFDALGDGGCRVQLTMRFDFAGGLRGRVLGPAFEHTCNRLVDAFVTRARRVYGGG